MSTSPLYAKMSELTQKGESFAVVTIIAVHGSSPRGVGAKMIVLEDGTRIGTIGGDCLENDAADAAVQMLTENKSGDKKGEVPAKVLSMLLEEEETGGVGMLCGGNVDILIEVVKPELQIVVVGSGPVATSMMKMADFIGASGVLIDPFPPRGSLPDSAKFLNTRHEEGLRKMHIGENSAIVIVTRHKNDVPALKAALATKASYIGMIGSKHRVQTIFNRLAKELKTEPKAFVPRVYAPVGLDIGAYTPQELAISIIAEILTHFRKGTAKSKALYAEAKIA
ncbi:MAG: XdhC family protein [Thaumarchaeota archaeon]|nr:XdhC family protein [Nitrososphaerota archaeon]